MIQNRWWSRVAITESPVNDLEPVIVQRVSLDDLSSQVVLAQNRVVHCEAELNRAQIDLEEKQRLWAMRIIERGRDLGIKEFCAIRMATDGDGK